ncbi:MAG: ABC transporter ATP-binding protein [Candidatus Korarchaeota archaeon]|nr:ABC transporter ATP-binding protein [Candidatus Korarchaeota archaeon]
MVEYIVETRNLTAGYGKAVIIQDVDFKAEKGKITAIVGPNGSGKSTFLKTLFGLTRVFNGSVIFNGEEITKLPPEVRARKGLGFVFQVNNVFPNLTVRENLEMGAYARKDKEEIRKDMEEILDIFPILRERQKQKAGSLSGGERQMLAMAMALMGRPTLLLLDEPAAALAPKVVTQIFMKIRDIVDTGVTVILVEQHAKRALSFCDMGYVFSSGRIVMKGPGKDLLADEKFVEAFLGKK